jgi:hypothetical protein
MASLGSGSIGRMLLLGLLLSCPGLAQTPPPTPVYLDPLGDWRVEGEEAMNSLAAEAIGLVSDQLRSAQIQTVVPSRSAEGSPLHQHVVDATVADVGTYLGASYSHGTVECVKIWYYSPAVGSSNDRDAWSVIKARTSELRAAESERLAEMIRRRISSVEGVSCVSLTPSNTDELLAGVPPPAVVVEVLVRASTSSLAPTEPAGRRVWKAVTEAVLRYVER